MVLKLYNGGIKKRRKFTPNEKARVVPEVLEGNRTLREIATEYKVHENQIQRWKKQFLENARAAFEKDNTRTAGEIRQLESEKEELFKKVGQLTVEVVWLKKNLVSKNSIPERSAKVSKDENISLRRQCELLGINRTRKRPHPLTVKTSYRAQDIISYNKPLYVRSSFKIHLRAFNYYEAANFYPDFSYLDKIRAYAVFGGIPFYLEKINDEVSLDENIIELVLKNGAPLENEIYFFLRQEVRTISSYASILNAIVNGATRLNEISTKSRIGNSGTTSKYLKILMDFDIVRKEICFGENSNSRKTIYKISDNFFHFYYKFVESNKSKVTIMSKKRFYDDFIKPHIDKYVSIEFETICRDFLILRNLKSDNSDYYHEIARYWYNNASKKVNIEIDIAAESKTGISVFECKWTNDIFRSDNVRKLKEKSAVINPVQYGGFSKSGFSDEALKELDEAFEPQNLFLKNSF